SAALSVRSTTNSCLTLPALVTSNVTSPGDTLAFETPTDHSSSVPLTVVLPVAFPVLGPVAAEEELLQPDAVAARATAAADAERILRRGIAAACPRSLGSSRQKA